MNEVVLRPQAIEGEVSSESAIVSVHRDKYLPDWHACVLIAPNLLAHKNAEMILHKAIEAHFKRRREYEKTALSQIVPFESESGEKK